MIWVLLSIVPLAAASSLRGQDDPWRFSWLEYLDEDAKLFGEDSNLLGRKHIHDPSSPLRIVATSPVPSSSQSFRDLNSTRVADILGLLQNGESIGPGLLSFTSQLVEYRHNSLVERIYQRSPKQFKRMDALSCLNGSWVFFYGDSRLRVLYAALAKMLVGSDLPEHCPHHDACPYSNKMFTHTPECKHYYNGNHQDCLDIEYEGVRLTFEWNQWAKPAGNHSQRLAKGRLSRQPDYLLVNNGAWEQYRRHTINFAEPPEGPESHEDRREFFREVGNSFDNPSLQKIAVGYPSCDFRFLMDEHYGELSHEGWMVYDPTKVTDSRAWQRLGKMYGRAWSSAMLPKSSLPSSIKWDTCLGPHTYDTLADLELQILLNSFCSLGR